VNRKTKTDDHNDDSENDTNYDLEKIVKDAMRKELNKRGIANILIAGRTGVGKSTLINAVFQGNLATTGQGRPVTKNTREIRKKGISVVILDTRGLELKDFNETLNELVAEVVVRSRNEDPQKHVHAVWICFSEDSRRVEKAESDLCEMLASHVPVIGVITKCRSDNGFRQEVQKLLPEARNVVRVRSIREILDEGTELSPYGLEELVDATMEVIPEGQQKAFAAAQMASLNQKKNQAHAVVFTSSSAAFTAGAVPIPFSDAAVLVPIQIAMLAGISVVFGIDLSKAFLSTLISSTLTGTGGTLVGRTIVANVLKMFPGIGWLAGGVISGTTAATITVAFGEAYIAILVYLIGENKGETPTKDQILKEFKKRLKKNK